MRKDGQCGRTLGWVTVRLAWGFESAHFSVIGISSVVCAVARTDWRTMPVHYSRSQRGCAKCKLRILKQKRYKCMNWRGRLWNVKLMGFAKSFFFAKIVCPSIQMKFYIRWKSSIALSHRVHTSCGKRTNQMTNTWKKKLFFRWICLPYWYEYSDSFSSSNC